MKAIFILLISLVLTFKLSAQTGSPIKTTSNDQQQKTEQADEQPIDAESSNAANTTESKTNESALKPEPKKKPEPRKEVFRPSEEISEDRPVPFPVDI